MSTPISRRAVLRGLAVGASAPVWLRFGEQFATAATTSYLPEPDHRLLVIFLRGGNDGLEMVAPIGDAKLLKARPNLALKASDVIMLGNGYGMNKQMPTIAALYKAGQAAIIQGVGTEDASFSHSVATRRWETASNNDSFSNGWLGRYLDATPARGVIRAAGFGDDMPLSLVGNNADALSLKSIGDFTFRDATTKDAAARHAALGRFGGAGALTNPLATMIVQEQKELLNAMSPIVNLATQKLDHDPTQGDNAAQLFAAKVGTEIAMLSVGGFDTHVSERSRQGSALSDLDDTVKNFFATATKLGVVNQSMVLVVTEFGRRVVENSSGGTDHGCAVTALALGPGVKGGMHGATPDFGTLVDGNLPAPVDFRSVYATVLSKWLQTNPAPILGGTFPLLNFV
jgi:uncharacterized protein (DUF1501 family)